MGHKNRPLRLCWLLKSYVCWWCSADDTEADYDVGGSDNEDDGGRSVDAVEVDYDYSDDDDDDDDGDKDDDDEPEIETEIMWVLMLTLLVAVAAAAAAVGSLWSKFPADYWTTFIVFLRLLRFHKRWGSGMPDSCQNSGHTMWQ